MSNFLLLLKTQFINILQTSSKKKKKQENVKGLSFKIGVTAVIAVLIVSVAYFYSRMFAEMLILSGDIYKLTPLMIGYGALVNMIFSFYSVGSVLFSNKDYELLSSLPVKKTTIVLSKLAVMLITSVALSLVISLPSLFVFSYYGAVLSTSYVFYCLILAIFAPLVIIAMITLIATAIYLAFARAKRKTLLQTLALFLFFVALFVIGFVSGEEGNMLAVVERIYFLFPIIIKATTDWTYLLLFIGISVVSFIIISLFVGIFYHKINTLLKRSYKVKNFKLKDYQATSQIKSVLFRELKMFFSYPIYIMNVLLGPIISIVASIAIAVLIQKMGGVVEVREMIITIVPSVLIFAHTLVSSTATAISIEGKSFWVIKTSPVKSKDLINAKLLVNVLLNVLPAVLSSLVIAIFVAPDVLYAFIIAVIIIGGALLSGTVGLLFNLRFPKLQWENPNQVAKNGLPILLCMLVCMIFSAYSIAVIFIANETFTPIILFSILAGVMVIANILCYILLIKKGTKMLEKI